MKESGCLICAKHADPTYEIYRDAFLVVNHFVPNPNANDNYLGYYMIESVRHFKGVYDATPEESAAFGQMVRNLAAAMKTALDAAHVYVFALGDGIDHLHMHVIAKYPDAPREFWGPRVDNWPDAPRGNTNAVLKTNALVASALKKTQRI